MTASHLDYRVTGWGFVVFAIGALFWSLVGFFTDQTELSSYQSFPAYR